MITYTFLAVIVVFSLVALNNPVLKWKYLFHPYSIYHNREHYRFLTHAFIHGDYMHLALNCLALYSFGPDIENYLFPRLFQSQEIGKLCYILLFTGGIYAASFTEYFRNKNNPEYSSLGASGAISSIMFCWILLLPKGSIGLMFIPVPIPGWIVGMLLLGVSFYLIQRKKKGSYNDNISHESHFWGAIFGILFILIAKPSVFVSFVSEIFK